jgi:bifunctional ADP-heptose synthase (sugar kinase/adenylyltransferase)
VANFCDEVGVLTTVGANDSQEDFLRQNINSRVNKMFLYKANSPTIVKRRFVESYLMQKLFEVCEINDEELDRTQTQTLCAMLDEVINKYDVVIVTDYGHGMLTKDTINLLCSKAHFLAVNTQANAANRGFNTISKYPRADFVSLAHHEIELEERNQERDLRGMILNVSQKLACGHIVVTRGTEGNVCYSKDEGFVEVPAFAHQVIDRVGAGDTVLSLTALCVAQRAPIEIVGFIGNVVGAQAVATVGHRTSIEPVSLSKHIESLLK